MIEIVWSRKCIERYVSEGNQTPFKAHIKNLKQKKPSKIIENDQLQEQE